MAVEKLSLNKSVSYTLNARNTPIALRTSALLFGLLLRLTGTFTVTGGTGAGTRHADSLFRLFRTIQVLTGGSSQLTLTGSTARFMDRLLNPSAFESTLPSALTAGLSESVEVNLYIPFAMPHSHDPYEFAMPAYGYGTDFPTLVIDAGAIGDVATGEDGTLALNSATLEVYEGIVEGIQTPTSEFGVLETFQTEETSSGSETARRVYLPSIVGGQHEIRAVIIEALNATTDAVSDTLISHVRLLVNGADAQEKVAWDVLRNINKVKYDMSAREAGVVVLDAADDKGTGPGELWEPSTGDRPYLELTTTGAMKVRVTVLAVRRRVYQAAAA
jgi:hypothetical protein